MHEMKDTWGDTILIDIQPGIVSIIFDELGQVVSRELDADQTRKLITELKKALDEMEDM